MLLKGTDNPRALYHRCQAYRYCRQAKLPADFVIGDVKERVARMGGATPINICLRQEVDRLQSVLRSTRSMLIDLQVPRRYLRTLTHGCPCHIRHRGWYWACPCHICPGAGAGTGLAPATSGLGLGLGLGVPLPHLAWGCAHPCHIRPGGCCSSRSRGRSC